MCMRLRVEWCVVSLSDKKEAVIVAWQVLEKGLIQRTIFNTKKYYEKVFEEWVIKKGGSELSKLDKRK